MLPTADSSIAARLAHAWKRMGCSLRAVPGAELRLCLNRCARADRNAHAGDRRGDGGADLVAGMGALANGMFRKWAGYWQR